MAISAQAVKALRERTGAGVMECKRALEEAGGDMERAVEILRQRGQAAALRRAGREAKEGLIVSYVHAGGRIGAMVEVNCETDFVARTDLFRQLAQELAMQVAAMNPRYLTREDVPPSVVEKEVSIYREQARAEGKPEHVLDRIAQGRLEKFFQEVCLMEQSYIRDDKRTVKELVNEAIARLGENIVVRRFVRFEVGEALDGE